jgi:malate synthase
VETAEGHRVTHALVERELETLLAGLERTEGDRFDDAAAVFRSVTLHEDFPTFLTITAYTRYLVKTREPQAA